MTIHAQRLQRVPTGTVLIGLLVAIVPSFYVTEGYAEELKIQRVRIESTPGGAAVSTIAGKRGVTPLSITERDIYPNTYPEAKVDLYGKVVVSKPGCETITRRITLDDIKNGLDFHLDCTASTPVTARKTVAKPQTTSQPEQPAVSIAEPLSDRRLRQLRVLDELLEDKLISAEEERVIRKRIFERLDQ